MLKLKDIHPLTGFLRNHKQYLARLRRTGRPEVLTVNGEARLVVQDSNAYQKLLERLDESEAIETIQRRIASLQAGEPGVDAAEVLAGIRRRLGVEGG